MDLKARVNEIIIKENEKITDEELSLLFSLSMYKILQSEYYQNEYKSIFISELKSEDETYSSYGLTNNEYNDVGPYSIGKQYTGFQPYYYEDEYLKQINVFVDKDIIDNTKKLLNYIRNSNDINELSYSLENEFNINNNFFNSLYYHKSDFKFFNPVEKMISSLVHKGFITSKEYKNSFYTDSDERNGGVFNNILKNKNIDSLFKEIFNISASTFKDHTSLSTFDKISILNHLVYKDGKTVSISRKDENLEQRVDVLFNDELNKIENKSVKELVLSNDKDKAYHYLNLHFNFVKNILIDGLQNNFNDINYLYNKHKEKVDNIIDQIYNEKPYLIEKPNINDISLFVYELQADDKISMFRRSLFEDPNNYSISDSTLQKYNIEKIFKELNPDSYKNETILRDFCFEQQNELFYEYQNEFYGLPFISRSQTESGHEHSTYIIAKKNDDVIGLLAFSSQKDSEILKNFNYINIKNNYRGSGLFKKFYNLLADLSLDENFIVSNSHYTELGAKKLPTFKENLYKEKPEFVMIDKDFGHLRQTDTYDYLGKFNEDLINLIKTNRLEIDKKNIDIFKKEYKKIRIDILSRDEGLENKHDSYKDIENFVKTLNKKFKFKVNRLKI